MSRSDDENKPGEHPKRPPGKIRLLVGSDNTLLLDLLAYRLARDADISLAAAAPMAPELLDLIGQMRPTVTLLTPRFSTGSGGEMELMRSIRTSFPEHPLLTLSSQLRSGQVMRLGEHGATCVLLESQGWHALSQAIRSVCDGRYGSGSVPSNSVLGINLSKEVSLTATELELIEHVSTGLANHEIAGRLNVSESTVRNRLSSVLIKLKVANRTQAVTEAIRLGYIEPRRPQAAPTAVGLYPGDE